MQQPKRDRLLLEAEVERRALQREAELKRLRILLELQRERLRRERETRPKLD